MIGIADHLDVKFDNLSVIVDPDPFVGAMDPAEISGCQLHRKKTEDVIANIAIVFGIGAGYQQKRCDNCVGKNLADGALQ